MYKACLLGGVFLFFALVFYSVTNPPLPSSQNPLLFYSNQTRDDLKILFKKAIESAQNSLFIQMYGCTDPQILFEIQKAKKRDVLVDLFYDASASGSLKKKLSFAIPLPSQGLMHKKIVIVDDELVFLGSANFTPTSLRMHDNLVVGIHQKELATFLKTSTLPHLTFKVGDQTAEFWHLPDFKDECLLRILKTIHEAKKSIHVALFTFTHPTILEALISAHKKGVVLHVAIDFGSAQGASKKAVDLLRKAGITPLISQGDKLLHHKWALIDQSTLLLGSANWTKSAFCSNDDCVLLLNDLTDLQQKHFERLWKEIERNSLH